MALLDATNFLSVFCLCFFVLSVLESSYEMNNTVKVYSTTIFMNSTFSNKVNPTQQTTPNTRNDSDIHGELESRRKIFENILQTLQVDGEMKVENLESLLQKLGMKNCSKASPFKCVSLQSLKNIHSLEEDVVIKESVFSQISTTIIISLTLPKSKTIFTREFDAYEEIKKKYSTSAICEQIVDQMLYDLNRTLGIKLEREKCFSAADLLVDLNLPINGNIKKKMVPKLHMAIISKLLQKQCIKIKYENPLPCTSYFAINLFQEYAHNNVIYKESVQELMKNLKLGRQLKNENYLQEELSENKFARRKRRRSSNLRKNQHGNFSNVYEKCYSVDELFSIYHVNKHDGFNIKRFESLSIALIDQIESNVCVDEHNDKDVGNDENNYDKETKTPNVAVSVWGFGVAAASIVSLISVLMIIPLLHTSFYKKSLVFLIALAVGTLVGDALFHLLPRATGFSYIGTDKDHFWRFFSVLGGIYGFFIFETTVHLVLRQKRTIQITSKKQECIDKNLATKTDEKNGKKMDNPIFIISNKMNEKEESAVAMNGHKFEIEDDIDDEKHIAPMAWTVIMGDTLHNIADGIAIGVAFSDNIAGGISTSIAVLCHEVPHELGDFVVLLSAGMSVRQAVVANFLSSCFCFMGLVLGKKIAEIEDANLWILGVTGGFFLYIALTNKLPELMHVTEESDQSKITLFLLQNTGVIIGFVCMFFLAYYKKEINI
ncbi:metal cation symporter ZIP14-like [Xenia sp. Carnegie-2017]|uniref:metal cation symporter ZIP14-like n=1 Tax=Xenia sp. Carnegie-2017 TaxID=2897299 RepID=UPI001F03B363|nr:metal cation symporter ZIP14-like [Xenia sp. Carnegie-2017]